MPQANGRMSLRAHAGESRPARVQEPDEPVTEPITLTLPGNVIDALAARIVSGVAAEIAGMKRAESPVYFTNDEAADYLRCKPQRIYDLVSERKLPVLKEGSRSLFRREHLDALVKERE